MPIASQTCDLRMKSAGDLATFAAVLFLDPTCFESLRPGVHRLISCAGRQGLACDRIGACCSGRSHLFFIRDVETGLVGYEDFDRSVQDLRLYYKAPLFLMRAS